MKIWIVRNTASSIMFGGLERLFVYFVKPQWHEVEYLPHERYEGPYPDIKEDQGFYKMYGWYPEQNKFGISKLSVGSWLGYDEDNNPQKDLCVYIWEKLCEHFKNADFKLWDEMEKRGEVRQKDFILEIDIKITINENTQKP